MVQLPLWLEYIQYHLKSCNICNGTSGEEDDSYMDSDEIVSRTQFPASWLWMDVKLPPCPETQPAW